MPLQLELKSTGFEAIAAYLDGVSHRLGDLSPAMHAIGESILEDIHRGFANAGEPNGRPWAALTAETWARKRTQTPMRESGELLASIQAHSTGTTATVGTPLDYGGYHQTGYRHGRSEKRVPARPIVGLGPSGLDKAAQILMRHINGAD